MAAAAAFPAAAIVRPSRRQDQSNFSYSLSIIKATSSFSVVPFRVSSSSTNFCSFLGSYRQYNDEPSSSFRARSSRILPRFLCAVSREIDSQREVDAKKERLKHAMVVKSDESTNRHVSDIQNSVSSERKTISKKGKNPKHLNSSASEATNRVEYFQVIRYPLITESTMVNIQNHNTLVFVVHEEADKKSIKDAAKKLFKIETKKINTSIMPDGRKKAYLMLTPNHSAADLAKKIKAI